jgi:hypothetical protein
MTVSEADQPFQVFLEELINIGWIESAKWLKAPNVGDMRQLMGETSRPGFTRTHKKINNKACLGLVVKTAPKTEVGVDLELIQNRNLLIKNRRETALKLGLPEDAAMREIVITWSAMEAAVKALSQYDQLFADVSWRNLRSLPEGGFDAFDGGRCLRRIEVRQRVEGSWILSFARCFLPA